MKQKDLREGSQELLFGEQTNIRKLIIEFRSLIEMLPEGAFLFLYKQVEFSLMIIPL